MNISRIDKENIIIRKIWEEHENSENFQIRISCMSYYASAWQNCYMNREFVKGVYTQIRDFTYNFNVQSVILDFGEKLGNFTPAFSLSFIRADINGNVNIEVDIEIDDNDSRCHRCKFYVGSELGLVEQFAEQLYDLADSEVGFEAILNPYAQRRDFQ